MSAVSRLEVKAPQIRLTGPCVPLRGATAAGLQRPAKVSEERSCVPGSTGSRFGAIPHALSVIVDPVDIYRATAIDTTYSNELVAAWDVTFRQERGVRHSAFCVRPILGAQNPRTAEPSIASREIFITDSLGTEYTKGKVSSRQTFISFTLRDIVRFLSVPNLLSTKREGVL
jgi:hypothetical protein